REELAALNLTAGKKAKDSAAYETAVRYLLTGIDLLGEKSWQNQYQLALALHNEAAEATYLNGEFAETERLVKQIFKHAKDVLDCVNAYQAQAGAYTAQNNLESAIYTILDATRRLGEPLPRHPNRLRVGLELLYTRFWVVGRRSMKELEALPPMTDPYKLATVNLLGSAALAAINAAPLLVGVLALRVVNLVVRYGSSPSSAVQGAAYGVMLRAGLGDIEGAYRFGQLSLRMLEQLNDRIYRTMTIVAHESCIRHWKEPLRPSLPVVLAAYQEGLELGNLEFSLVAAQVYCIHSFILGEPLADVEKSFQEYISQMRQFNLIGIVYQTQPWHQLVLNLQGQASDPTRLMGTAFNEAEMLPILIKNQQGIPLFYTQIARTIWLYFAGDYVGSLEAAKLAKPLEESAPATPGFAIRYFYESLACLGLCSRLSKAKQKPYLQQVARNQRKAKRWAKYCPENYQHRYDLVEAERSRIAGRTTDAMTFYDRAIQGAIAQEYPNEAALANELAAKFYFQLGNDRIAQVYLLDAHYGYLRWGATFKVEALETAYPQLRDRVGDRSTDIKTTVTASQASLSGKSSSSSNRLNLDLNTVIKAAQTISGEIILDKLLAKLMALVIENAGAQKGYLLLVANDELRIEAEGHIGQANQANQNDRVVVRSRSLTDESALPLSIINYVQRTRENVVLGDALEAELFATDPYIVQTQPRSVLCSPILNQGNLLGMVYLENNLATDTFTPERLTILNILSAQAAIALENASFYRTLEDKVEDRTAQLAAANEEITQLNQRLQSENLRMSAELDVTRRLQQLVLPKVEELNQISELDISGFMKPADEVGGDYYDVLKCGDQIKIGIGDVTGHGLESGVLMLMVQTAIRTLMMTGETNSVRFLNILNHVIFDNIQRMNSERTLTLTMVDYQSGNLRLSGQHEDVLVVRASGVVERVSTGDLGFPIGLIEDIAEFVNQMEISLQPGDGIVLFTDGITEALSEANELYGVERLCQIVAQSWQASAQAIRQAIIQDVRHHIGQQKVYDDITLLVIKQK
ncbi:MAG: SpoIIE family protein phosphatase, partial [Leptolyngbyaceae cyanobacterium bins.302]|nr:SpoIIE family protein phosphatase [Leptolyngbyaceae cyanobacterium bins.302]